MFMAMTSRKGGGDRYREAETETRRLPMETELDELESLFEQWSGEVSMYPEPRRSEAQALLDTWRERYRDNVQLKAALRGIDQAPEPERGRLVRTLAFWVALVEATIADESADTGGVQ